jgi:hypothetical protein
MQYQNQCRKLPKALRDWQAYVDCRDTIDSFLELLPLFQVGQAGGWKRSGRGLAATAPCRSSACLGCAPTDPLPARPLRSASAPPRPWPTR